MVTLSAISSPLIEPMPVYRSSGASGPASQGMHREKNLRSNTADYHAHALTLYVQVNSFPRPHVLKGVPGPKPPKFLFVAKESKKFRSNWACARGAVRPSNAAAAAGERREGMIRELSTFNYLQGID